MRILHLSYAAVSDYSDPEKWLARLYFFTVMLEKMAEYAEVLSVHCIKYEGVLERKGVHYHFLKKRKSQIRFPFRIHRYIGKLQPDIVIVHGLIFAWQVLWLRLQLGRSVKLVLVHHSERPLKWHRFFFQTLADKFISAYFFTSHALGQRWVDAGLIRDPSKIHEVMIGSSVFFPYDRLLSQKHTRVNGSFLYLWIGHLDVNKDPFTLISGFKLFVKDQPEAKLYMIFQGDQLREQVRLLVNSCKQIVMVGKVSHRDLLYWYNSVDFIISTSHYEGGGIAVCEAMSCGCVPILTNIPSFLMMTGPGEVGLVFAAGNITGLHTALVESRNLDLDVARKKVLLRFQRALSNEVIVKKMIRVFLSLNDGR
ncbi:MAG: glycosyltransferase family 4 protein [Cyclobacteriaceae bacterium]